MDVSSSKLCLVHNQLAITQRAGLLASFCNYINEAQLLCDRKAHDEASRIKPVKAPSAAVASYAADFANTNTVSMSEVRVPTVLYALQLYIHI